MSSPASTYPNKKNSWWMKGLKKKLCLHQMTPNTPPHLRNKMVVPCLGCPLREVNTSVDMLLWRKGRHPLFGINGSVAEQGIVFSGNFLYKMTTSISCCSWRRTATALTVRNYEKTSTLLSWTWRVSFWTGSLGRFLFNQNSGKGNKNFPEKFPKIPETVEFSICEPSTRTENSVNSRSKVE